MIQAGMINCNGMYSVCLWIMSIMFKICLGLVKVVYSVADDCEQNVREATFTVKNFVSCFL